MAWRLSLGRIRFCCMGDRGNRQSYCVSNESVKLGQRYAYGEISLPGKFRSFYTGIYGTSTAYTESGLRAAITLTGGISPSVYGCVLQNHMENDRRS